MTEEQAILDGLAAHSIPSELMEFRIADTFTESLARLPNEEQKAVKTAAFDLQVNPAHPSLQFHKLAKAKDPRRHVKVLSFLNFHFRFLNSRIAGVGVRMQTRK